MPSVSRSRPHTHSHSHLAFARAPDGETFLTFRQVRYPLHVTRPFMLAERPAGMATLYLQSVSGGLYGGDELSLSIRCDEGSAAHVTTQSPEVVHRAHADSAHLRVDIEVRAGALFEYLPDPVVMFPGASLQATIEARVDDGATLLLSDGLLAHDPTARDEPFAFWDSRVHIADARGKPLLRERLLLQGERHLDVASRRDGLGRSQASLLLVSPGTDSRPMLQAAREALQATEGVYAGACTLAYDAGLIVRVTASEADQLAAAVHAAWSALRTVICGVPPAARRK